jgi:hypothetical protein
MYNMHVLRSTIGDSDWICVVSANAQLGGYLVDHACAWIDNRQQRLDLQQQLDLQRAAQKRDGHDCIGDSERPSSMGSDQQ